MILKQYQEKVLKALKEYLTSLSEFNTKYEKALAFDADVAKDYNFPQRAYKQVTGSKPVILPNNVAWCVKWNKKYMSANPANGRSI